MIVDIREPYEHAIAPFPNAVLIPMREVMDRRELFDPARVTVVLCHGGVRSAAVIRTLQESGHTGPLLNLKGGIDAWSNEVDPTVAKY